VSGGLGDEAARLVARIMQTGLQSRPEVLRHLAAAAGSVAAALETLAAEAEQARSEQARSEEARSEQEPEGPGDEPGTSRPATGQQDGRVDVQKIDVTD
jgi:hypothetical protein